MSESDPNQTSERLPSTRQRFSTLDDSGLWSSVWLGTASAGAMFGLLLGLTSFVSEGVAPAIFTAVIGFAVGFLYAGFVAVPVILVTATAYWAIGSTRWRVFLTVIAGCATGTLCSLPLASDDGTLFPLARLGLAVILAGLLGSAGAWLATVKWAKSIEQKSRPIGVRAGESEIPVASRFFRFGVLVIVIAAFVAAFLGFVGLIQHSREVSRCNSCRNKLKQIALCLQCYESSYHSLPPAYSTDKDGNPVLSWRVAAVKYFFYDMDFSKLVDLNQPWNSAENAEILNSLSGFCHCPSSGKERNNPTTDYVAVVGPDTLWPGKEPGDLKKHPKGILIVEWPRSDIHWTEPRDITVEEFLDLFRNKPPRRSFLEWLLAKPAKGYSLHPNCLLYVDAEGNVGELQIDTDPDTVRKILTGQSTVTNTPPAASGAILRRPPGTAIHRAG